MIKTAFSTEHNFEIPFESVIPRTDESFEYLLTSSLSLSFYNLVMMSDKSAIDTDLIEVITKLDIIEATKKTIAARIKNIEEFEDERIARHFSGGQHKPIFFDLEESSRLNDLFISVKFLAEAEILLNGQPIEFIKLKPLNQERVIRAMENLGLVYEQGPSEYKSSANIRRVTKLVKRSKYNGGIVAMNKKDLIKKSVFGSIAIAVGGAVIMTGGITLHKSLSILLGVSKEVILVENDVSEKASE